MTIYIYTIYNTEPFCRLLGKNAFRYILCTCLSLYTTQSASSIQHHRSWLTHSFQELLPTRMASPLTSAYTTAVHDSNTELLTFIVLYTCLPRLCVLRRLWSRIKFMRLWHLYSLPWIIHSSKCVGASFLLACVCTGVIRPSWSRMFSTGVIL